MTLWLSGCFELTGPLPGEAPVCVADSDCEGAEVCDVPSGSCVAAVVSEPLEVIFQVLGSSRAEDVSTPRVSLPSRTIVDATSQQTLTLPATVRAQGTLRVGEEVVAADLRFTREGEPGPVDDPAVTVETVAGDDVDFVASLLADATYTLEVLPLPSLDAAGVPWSRRLPPRRFEGLRTPPLGELLPLPLSYPDSLDTACGPGRATGCRLVGVVLEEAPGGARRPLPGLSVRASERRSGALVSSVGETDAQGIFALVISPDASPDYLLSVAPTERSGSEGCPSVPAEAGALVPTTTVDPAFLVPGEVLQILAPRPRRLCYGGSVRLPNSMVAEGALIELSSLSLVDATSGPPGVFSAPPERVDDRGGFTAEILAGEYRVTITPVSDDGTTAIHVEDLILTPDEGVTELLGQGFDLQTRTSFEGDLTASQVGFGEPVTIRAVPRPGATPLEQAARVVQTTGESGFFQLRLDVGVYDVFFQPEPATGRAWQVLPDLHVESTGDFVPDFDVELGAPLRIDGQVQDPGGTPCVGAVDEALAPPCAGAQ
ncbi:MAG: hypothetical protein AAF447_20150, partial [Myxococcota bacterium]